MVEHLAGMQAQAPFPPYFGLLARLDGFRTADLAGIWPGPGQTIRRLPWPRSVLAAPAAATAAG